MSEKRPVRYVELTTLAHATEDKDKVLRAIINLFPAESNLPGFDETKLTGFFGDPLISFRLEITKRRQGTELLEHFIKNLNSLDYSELIENLPNRMDESKNLYLRFDKQKAYQGTIKLEMHDAIRIKFRLQVPWGSDPVEFLTDYIENISLGIE